MWLTCTAISPAAFGKVTSQAHTQCTKSEPLEVTPKTCSINKQPGWVFSTVSLKRPVNQDPENPDGPFSSFWTACWGCTNTLLLSQLSQWIISIYSAYPRIWGGGRVARGYCKQRFQILASYQNHLGPTLEQLNCKPSVGTHIKAFKAGRWLRGSQEGTTAPQ